MTAGRLRVVFGACAVFAAFRVSVADAAGTVRATDSRGQEVALAAPARGIVCLIESALSGLYMLGAREQVVGIPRAALEPAIRPFYEVLDERIRTGKVAVPGSWDFVSIEQVVALRPDLVIVWASQREAIAALEARRIPVFAVYLKSFRDVEREIQALGVLTGREARARTVLEIAKAELASVTARTAGIPREQSPRGYFVWAQGDLDTSCRGSTVDDVFRLAGARNACTLEAEHVRVNLEQLLSWNPDLIVLWPNPRRDPRDLLSDARLAPVSAVRTRRVHELPSPFECDFWTLKFVNGVRRVAAWAHPERFAGVDLDAEARRTMTRLYGVPLGSTR